MGGGIGFSSRLYYHPHHPPGPNPLLNLPCPVLVFLCPRKPHHQSHSAMSVPVLQSSTDWCWFQPQWYVCFASVGGSWHFYKGSAQAVQVYLKLWAQYGWTLSNLNLARLLSVVRIFLCAQYWVTSKGCLWN